MKKEAIRHEVWGHWGKDAVDRHRNALLQAGEEWGCLRIYFLDCGGSLSTVCPYGGGVYDTPHVCTGADLYRRVKYEPANVRFRSD